MSDPLVVFGTIQFEELPVQHEHHPLPSLRPTSIEEDEDDPRSLLYLFEDNDFEQAAAFLAIEEARQQAQAAAEALAEEQRRIIQQQRIRSLAARLEQLLEEDDELIDMLGRRILAKNGYQTKELWGLPHYHRYGHHIDVSQIASTSYMRDAHTAWNDLADEARVPGYARASPFIHAAPVMLRGHQQHAPKSQHRAPPSVTTSSAERSTSIGRHARIAVHPLTGVPMLLMEDDALLEQDRSGRNSGAQDYNVDADEEEGPWPIDDESDYDWLGRELLRRQGGANFWILGTDDREPSTHPTPSVSAIDQAQQTPGNAAPVSSAAAEAELATPAPPNSSMLPSEVEEVDSDHELANIASNLTSSGHDGVPLHRVAAALAHATRPESGNGGPTRRQRAATVMSESEEEELETVGKPIEDEGKEGDAGSLNDRPKKSIKIVDVR